MKVDSQDLIVPQTIDEVSKQDSGAILAVRSTVLRVIPTIERLAALFCPFKIIVVAVVAVSRCNTSPLPLLCLNPRTR
jgi:hypothetical protein